MHSTSLFLIPANKLAVELPFSPSFSFFHSSPTPFRSACPHVCFILFVCLFIYPYIFSSFTHKIKSMSLFQKLTKDAQQMLHHVCPSMLEHQKLNYLLSKIQSQDKTLKSSQMQENSNLYLFLPHPLSTNLLCILVCLVLISFIVFFLKKIF